MPSALAHPNRPALQLAPFVLLSLLLHMALLFFIRLPTKSFTVTQRHTLQVNFSAPAVYESARIPGRTRTHVYPARLPAFSEKPAVPHDATSPTVAQAAFDTQKLIELARSMARDDARKTELDFAATEKKRLNTPAATLEQYLRQPHEEIHLANGMLKIITSAGAICFQPVPYFAQNAAGVFGIPSSCP